MSPDGSPRAGDQGGVQPASLDRSGGVRRRGKRLVGGQAQRAGDGAALGLLGLDGDQQGLSLVDLELGADRVAGVEQALGEDAAGLAPAAAPDPQPGGDIEQAAFDAEGGQGLQPQAKPPDVQSYRQGAAGRPGGRQHRPAQHANVLGGQDVDLQPATEQGRPGPADRHMVGLRPDSLGVRDGQPVDREVAPDIALQALDPQLASLAERQAADLGRDHPPPHLRDAERPDRQGGREHDKQSRRKAGEGPSRERTRPVRS